MFVYGRAVAVPAHLLEQLQRESAFADDGWLEVDAEMLVSIVLELLDRRHQSAQLRSALADSSSGWGRRSVRSAPCSTSSSGSRATRDAALRPGCGGCGHEHLFLLQRPTIPSERRD